MPRIGNIRGPYRFFFTSFDCNEPPHIHVEREDRTCKFWLEPLGLARNHGFSARELNVIRRVIEDHRTAIIEVWHEHCG
ncbi:MAG: DUF4160 domain-containing protein [Acidobacteria bacterium]|nr:DUF4160 domain-containing protein [Acidobacteriota bacterium]MBI3469751.1 DUF4160 domain-containing protein [Candidatus Solibacter usitatus]